MAALQLEVLGCGVQIECADKDAHALLRNIYLSFERPTARTRVSYHITPGSSDDFFLSRHGGRLEIARGPGDFICKFDKDLIVEAQKLRPDLYFVHGLQVSTANVNSAPGAGMTRFAEVIERNTYNAGLPDPSIMLFVGIGLVVLGICGQRRGKRIIRQ